MREDKSPSGDGLRRRAEELLQQKTTESPSSQTEAESRKLLHELQVHQIELEMQNAELSQARDELEAALERYTDLYDFAPVGYFTLDSAGVIREGNLAGALLLGIERSRLPGRRFDLFVTGQDRPAFAAFFTKLLASRGRETCEAVLTPGGERLIQVQIQAVSGESGQEARFAVMDISDRKRMEEKLETLNTSLAARAGELENATIELEAFNASVSHDLRGPLGNITGYCQVVQEFCADQLDEECSGYIRNISEAAHGMARLIETLLNFSLILRVQMRTEAVDLGGLAQAVAASFSMAEPGHRVTFRIAEGMRVRGDASLLKIVLTNLIGNAWKYSGQKEGTVIEFGVTETEGERAYFVRDNGPGFDMADAGQLFAPFHRLPGTEVQGHGIGLATVERIIRRHGGRIWAESEPGQGACFYFTLHADGT